MGNNQLDSGKNNFQGSFLTPNNNPIMFSDFPMFLFCESLRGNLMVGRRQNNLASSYQKEKKRDLFRS